MKRFAVTLLAFSLPALTTASALPYGGARVATAAIEAAPTAGLILRKATLIETPGGSEVRGSVCRAPSRTATGRVGIQLQRRDAGGQVTEQGRMQLPTALGVRDRACATFAIPVTWTVASGDTLQLCADRVGGTSCAVGSARD